MNRKKFFSTAAMSLLGIAVSQVVPFKLFFKKNDSTKDQKIKVKINPLSVQRENKRTKNV